MSRTTCEGRIHKGWGQTRSGQGEVYEPCRNPAIYHVRGQDKDRVFCRGCLSPSHEVIGMVEDLEQVEEAQDEQ